MQNGHKLFSLACVVCFVCAVVVACLAWSTVPLLPVPWKTVLAFFVFASIAELLVVSVGGDANRISVSPTGPVHRVATCVMGPFVAVMVCIAAGFIGNFGKGLAYFFAKSRFAKELHSEFRASSSPIERQSFFHRFVSDSVDYIERLAGNWYAYDVWSAIEAFAMSIGNTCISVGLSGITYYYLGGKFLEFIPAKFHLLREFILPFVGLAIVATVIDWAITTVFSVLSAPAGGPRGVYGVLLQVKLTLAEVVTPFWRGEMFLLVVALLISYLYIYIGVLGFVLAIMPILALRDFYRQWVETKAAYLDTITTLATYMQHYHPYTRGHLKRVSEISGRLARELRLPVESIRHINVAAFLHDIGKIGVSEEILDKTEKLTDDEWDRIKEHPVKSAEIVNHIEFFEGIVDWVKYHHKWYNGAGYPAGDVKAEDIPIEAAIIAVADAFDAMTDDRELSLDWKCDSCGYRPEDDGERPNVCPRCSAEKRRRYREPRSLEQAMDELSRGAGSQFHPGAVKAFQVLVARDGI